MTESCDWREKTFDEDILSSVAMATALREPARIRCFSPRLGRTRNRNVKSNDHMYKTYVQETHQRSNSGV